MAVQQLEAGQHEVTNAYPRFVTREGNQVAQKIISQVFEPVDRSGAASALSRFRAWAAPGVCQLQCLPRFELDQTRFTNRHYVSQGKVLSGIAKPLDCPAFSTECTLPTLLARRWYRLRSLCCLLPLPQGYLDDSIKYSRHSKVLARSHHADRGR
jgi:hydrogenase expression/formation protein HypD